MRTSVVFMVLSVSLLAQPTKDRRPAPVYTNLTDTDGTNVPDIAGTKAPSRPSPLPEGYLSPNDVNRVMQSGPPRTVCFDVFVTNTTQNGSPMGMMKSLQTVSLGSLTSPGTTLAIDQTIADRLAAFRKHNSLGTLPLAMRVTGMPQRAMGPQPLFVVEKVEFLTPDGNAGWSVARTEAFQGPNMNAPPGMQSLDTMLDSTREKLETNPKSFLRGMPIMLRVKLLGVDDVAVNDGGDFTLKRLKFESDAKGKPIRNLYVFANDNVVKQLKTVADSGKLSYPAEMMLAATAHRFDAATGAVVASCSRLDTYDPTRPSIPPTVMISSGVARSLDPTLRNGVAADRVKIVTPPLMAANTPDPAMSPIKLTPMPANTPDAATAERSVNVTAMIITLVIGLAVAGGVTAFLLLRRKPERDDDEDFDDRPRRRPR